MPGQADHRADFRGGRVVVIGAGVVGASVAYHLTRAGHSDVVVLDRGLPGEGTTAAGTGGIRQQFTSRVNAALVHRSVELFTRFSDDTGHPFDFRQHGYLFVLTRPEDVEVFGEAVAMQQSLGIPSRLLAPDEIADVAPHARTSDVLGATYCPTDGSATPQDAVTGWLAAARAAGAEVRTRTEVTGFLNGPGGAVTGVRTTGDTVEAEVVIVATGPQARATAALAGVHVPVAPHRRQAFSIAPLPWLTGDLPLTVDLTSGAYLHPEKSGGGVIGGNDRSVPEGTGTSVDYSLVEPLCTALAHRFPGLSDAAVENGWAGLREMTPDDHAVVGPIGTAPGLWAAAGFSGHGFMQSPAIGEAIAQSLLKGVSDIDLTPLRHTRFAENDLAGESVLF